MIERSYACPECIERFIGPALIKIERPATIEERDKCYGCGDPKRRPMVFTYDPDREYA